MKSLEEREKQRAKQKANEAKTRGDTNQSASKESTSEEFDAADWVNDKVENINANLSDLSDEELTLIEDAEGKGRKRQGVLAAIKKEKDDRAGKSVGWKNNQA